MDLYRRIAAIREQEDADDLLDEMLDRYGEIPKSVLTLLDVALLRAAAAKVGIIEIVQKGNVLHFTMDDVDLKRLAVVCGMKKYYARLRVGAGNVPCMMLHLQPKQDVLEQAMELMDAFSGAGDEKETEQ